MLPQTRATYEAALNYTLPLTQEPLTTPTWTTLSSLDLPLIGRDKIWLEMEKAYHRFKIGGVIFISGEAGVGKSRIMEAFATAHSAQLILTGYSHATGQALPYQPLVQSLRQSLPLIDRWANLLPVWLAEISRLLPELRNHFPDLPPPTTVAPQETQAHLFEAITEIFIGLAGSSPLILCLDDIHWSDDTTLGWLQYVTHRLPNSNLCILATYRTHEAKGLTEWQRELSRSNLSANIRLPGLSETAVVELFNQAGTKKTAIPMLALKIHEATGGNAFFVLETIRELLVIDQNFDDMVDLPLPQTVRDTVLRRTAHLTPLAQQMAATAAVLSPHMNLETLVETSGRSEMETILSLEELLAQQLLQAELYLQMEQPTQAKNYLHQGFELLNTNQNWYGLSAPLYMVKGMLASIQQHGDEAEYLFTKAIAINRQYQLPWDEARCYYEWGQTSLALGNPKKAEKQLKVAQRLFKKVGANTELNKLATLKYAPNGSGK